MYTGHLNTRNLNTSNLNTDHLNTGYLMSYIVGFCIHFRNNILNTWYISVEILREFEVICILTF